jgi:hypothetical protein
MQKILYNKGVTLVIMNYLKNKYTLGLMALSIALSIVYFFYSRDLPSVSSSLSGTGSILVSRDSVIIDLNECKPDIRLIDVERNPIIIEVVEKKFDVCLINYGKATHKRNLVQRLPNRCQVPWENRSELKLPMYEKLRIDLTSLSEFCEPKIN